MLPSFKNANNHIIKSKGIKKPNLFDFITKLENVNQDFLCSLCCTLFYLPVKLQCNHSFCNHCLESWFNHEKDKLHCPLCFQEYPLSIKIEIDKELKRKIELIYKKELEILKEFRTYESKNKKSEEVKFIYGNTYQRILNEERWKFFFYSYKGKTNQYVDKIILNINPNNEGKNGNIINIEKEPFVFIQKIINNNNLILFVKITIIWQKCYKIQDSCFNFNVILNSEGCIYTLLMKIKKIK